MRRSAAVYHKFTEEEIRQANSVDILSLARGYGYEPEKAGRKAVHRMTASRAAPLILSCGRKTCPSRRRWAS